MESGHEHPICITATAGLAYGVKERAAIILRAVSSFYQNRSADAVCLCAVPLSATFAPVKQNRATLPAGLTLY